MPNPETDSPSVTGDGQDCSRSVTANESNVTPTLTTSPTLDQFGRLQVAADIFNREIFEGGLPPVFIQMVKKPGCHGFFAPNRLQGRNGKTIDMIGLDATTAIERPLSELLATLVHEQCHQAVFEAKGRQSTGGHGKEWRALMERAGLPPVMAGGSWRRATHQIDPNGLFMRVFNANVGTLKDLPWQEASRLQEGGKKKKDRVKFVCDSCGLNTWSKPSAQLLCGTCSRVAPTGPVFVQMRCTEPDPDQPQGGAVVEPSQKPAADPAVVAELLEHTGIDHLPAGPVAALDVFAFNMNAPRHKGMVRKLMVQLGTGPKDECFETLDKVLTARLKQVPEEAEAAREALEASAFWIRQSYAGASA